MPGLLELTPKGLYCAAGDFFIDPWLPVGKAVITHAHSDHAAPGHGAYLCSKESYHVLRARMGEEISIQTLEFGEKLRLGETIVSLHPAGHILGSAQVRVERNGEVWVVSGDYKTEKDATCSAFEPLRCHTFITECTFGMPIYKWRPEKEIFAEINSWWKTNQEKGRVSVLFGYSLGKLQRVLSGLDPSLGPIFTHGAVERMTEAYRVSGIPLPLTQPGTGFMSKEDRNAIILAPPSALNTPWLRRFGTISTAFASGWMAIRGTRRRKSLDKGFVLSDHVDWPNLLQTIKDTGASHVIATHGYTHILARYLRERGYESSVMQTRFEGENFELQNKDEETEAAE